MVSFSRCNVSRNTPDDPSGRICLPNKTENGNWNVVNMIARIDQAKTLTKHILCDCKCKFYDRKCNPNQNWNKGYVNLSAKDE